MGAGGGGSGGKDRRVSTAKKSRAGQGAGKAATTEDGFSLADVMVNCSMMGVDWRGLTWWQYQAHLSVWNDRQNGEGDKPVADVDRLKRAMAAHSIH